MGRQPPHADGSLCSLPFSGSWPFLRTCGLFSPPESKLSLLLMILAVNLLIITAFYAQLMMPGDFMAPYAAQAFPLPPLNDQFEIASLVLQGLPAPDKARPAYFSLGLHVGGHVCYWHGGGTYIDSPSPELVAALSAKFRPFIQTSVAAWQKVPPRERRRKRLQVYLILFANRIAQNEFIVEGLSFDGNPWLRVRCWLDCGQTGQWRIRRATGDWSEPEITNDWERIGSEK